ncbi:MAG: hypothetical protein ACK4MV_07245 [Beijerinckiaceae bacterium]
MLTDHLGAQVRPPFIINGVRHPDSIEHLWSAAELESIGLTRQPDPQPEPPAAAVPDVISDRQFIHQLRKLGLVTQAQALAFVKTGTAPPILADVVAQIPDQEERDDAELLLSGAVEFRRAHPLVALFAASQDPPWTDEQVDQFFRDASAL